MRVWVNVTGDNNVLTGFQLSSQLYVFNKLAGYVKI